MKQKIIITLIVLPLSLFGGILESETSTRKVADAFMKKVTSESYKEAFEYLAEFWPLPKEEVMNLAYQTDSQLKMLGNRFGSVLGFEYIGQDKIGDSFMRYLYIQKFEKHATRWMIVFYKPKQEWIVNNVMWDDEAYEIFDMN